MNKIDPKDPASKIRLVLLIKKFFEENTDEENGALISDIQRYLKLHDYEPSKDLIKHCIDALNLDEMDIQLDENRKKWKLIERDFDVAEVNMLIDCVASARFLPEDKSRKLIEDLKKLVSIYQRRKIFRRVTVLNQFRSSNKSVLYTIDAIQIAISNFKDIKFKYFQYNMNKEQVLKDNGKIYQVHPRELVYDNNLYYMVASAYGEETAYRVDKMTDVQVIERDYKWYDCSENMREKYAKKTKIQMLFKKDMMDIVIDKFGKDVNTEIVDDNHFRVKVEMVPDSQFFSWIFGLEDNVMIEYPLAVAAQMMDMLKDQYKAYREQHSRNIYYYRRKAQNNPHEE